MTNKYFLDSYIVKDKINNKYIWIYGYLLKVENDLMSISVYKVKSKLNLYRVTGIIEFLEDDKIIESLLENIIDNLKISIIIPDKLRPNLLSGINYNLNVNKPTNELSNLEEYWNLDKESLLLDIRKVYKNRGNNTNNKIIELINILKTLTGIDFTIEPQRFGNLEVYKFINEKNNITHRFTKDNKFIVDLKEPYSNDIYVKVYSENNKRCVINELKIIKKGNNQISFSIPENTFHVLIEIWDYSGKIIYFSNQYYMRSIIYKGFINNASYKVEDLWSKKLKTSTKYDISDIENVAKVSKAIESEINPSLSSDLFYYATETCRDIFNEFYNKNIKNDKGMFIKSASDSSGEIYSYKAIKNLIDSSELEKVIIMDPYFSIEASSKLLTRINNDVEIIVITSLTNINPDNNNESEKYIEKFKNNIRNNISIFHRRLKIINILSGTKEAFHDRYLIRIFSNKDTDGFILSNSLNSMGRSYPFLISPLEQEITYKVIDYIKELIDYNNKGYSREYKDIRKEIIFDYKMLDNKEENNDERVLFKILSKKNDYTEAVEYCVKRGFLCNNIRDDKYEIPIEKYKQIITKVISNWKNNSENTIKGIGEFLYYHYITNNQISDVYYFILSLFEENNIAKNEVIEQIEKVMQDLESKVDINSLYFSNYTKQLFLVLNNKAEPNYYYIYKNPKYIVEGKYLNSLYKLLWKISTESYVDLLKERKSPFMLGHLIYYLKSNSFNFKLYKQLIDSEMEILLYIANYWISNEYLFGKLKIDEFENDFENYSGLFRLKLLNFILAYAIFNSRINKSTEINNVIDNIYMKIIAIINDNFLSKEDTKASLDILSDILLEEKILISKEILPFINNHELIDFIVDDLVLETLNYIDTTELPLYEKDKLFINNLISILKQFKDEEYLIKEFYSNKFLKTYFELENNPLMNEINHVKWKKLVDVLSFKNFILHRLMYEGYDFLNLEARISIGDRHLNNEYINMLELNDE